MQCDLDHIVLNVKDDSNMLAFYSKILLLETERVEEYYAGEVAFPSVRLNSTTVIDLFPKALSEQSNLKNQDQQNLNHFCLTLNKDDWQQLVARLDSHSVKIEEGPTIRWGARGQGISIYFRDPEANLIEARYYDNRT